MIPSAYVRKSDEVSGAAMPAMLAVFALLVVMLVALSGCVSASVVGVEELRINRANIGKLKDSIDASQSTDPATKAMQSHSAEVAYKYADTLVTKAEGK